MKKIQKFLFLIIVVLGVHACTMEKQLALEFVKNEGQGTPVLLSPPPILNMFNNNPISIIDYHENLNYDSLNFYHSIYLQHISDSVFLEKYMNAFISHSRLMGLDVFLPHELDRFIQLERLAYIVNIPQMELHEDTIAWEIEEQINFRKTTRIIPINKISLSTWFEISQKDASTHRLYFDEQFITDETYGDFSQDFLSTDIKYDASVFEIETEDIYEFATELGQLHASFLYDLILNTYIWNHIDEDKKGRYIFLHYNHTYHSVEAAEQTFIHLDDD